MNCLRTKYLLSLFLIIGISFFSKAQEAVFLTESFEGTFPPSGWHLENSGGNEWEKNFYSASDGNASAKYRYHSTQAANAWIFTSAISLTQGVNIEVYFDHRISSISYPEVLKLTVGNAQDMASQTTVLWDDTLLNTSFVTQKVTYTVPATGVYYFAWNCHSKKDMSALYMDNIIIKEEASCPAPTDFELEDITAQSVQLNWTAGGQETQWVVEYGLAGFEVGQGTSLTINGTPEQLLSGLSPNTAYDVYVKAVCAADDISLWTDVASFTTLCVGVDDINQDFQSANVPELPSCWSNILLGGYSYAKTFTDGDNKYAKVNGKTGTYTKAILITPLINNLKTNAANKRLKVRIGNSCTVVLGVMSDNTQDTTFTELVTVPDNNNSAFRNHEFVFTAEQLALIEDNDKYFAFKTPSYSGVFTIDDFVWEDLPSCMHPFTPSVENVTDVSAIVKWETGGADHWDIEVVKAGEDATGNPTFQNISENPYTITNLEPNTSYTFYVRDRCSDADLSEWEKYDGTFKTNCTITEGALVEDFNLLEVPNVPECWTIVKKGSGAYNTGITGVADLGYQNTAAIRITNGSMTNSDYQLILVSPPLAHLSDETYQLRVLMKNEGSIRVGTMLHPDSINTFVADTLFAGNNEGYVERVIVFDNAPDNHKYIAFKHLCNVSSKPVFVDNFNWDVIPSCPLAGTLSVQSKSSDAITLQWEALDEVASYEIEYIEEDGTLSGTASVTDITENSVTINGLTPRTTYRFALRNRCSESEVGPWSLPFLARTTCSSFDNIAKVHCEDVQVPELPECWTSSIQGPDGHHMLLQTTTYNTSKVVRMYNEDYDAQSGVVLMFISPEISDLEAGTHQLRMRVSNKKTDLGIGVMSNPLDASTYVPIDTVKASMETSMRDTVISFANRSNITSEHKYIVFKHLMTESTRSIYLDDIAFQPITSCHWPTGLEVHKTFSTKATIKWNKQAEATYDVEVVEAGADFTNTPTYSNIADTVFEITNLLSKTTYKYQVRTHCSASSESGWEPADETFTTRSAGDICEEPIVVSFTDNVFSDVNQTTVGRGDDVRNTYLQNYDNGPDIFYQLDVQEAGIYSFRFNPKNTKYTGIGIFNGCPGVGNGVAKVKGTDKSVRVISEKYLEAGVYFIMIDCYAPNPDDIPNFDLTIEKVTCPLPKNVEVVSFSNTSAEIKWRDISAQNWDIKYAVSSEDEPTSVSIENITSQPYSLTGLLPETEYKLWVRADCNSDNTDTTDWSDPVTFTTLANCPKPVDVEIQPLINSATISWNGYFATHWDVVVDTAGFNINTTAITQNDVAENTTVVNNLQAGTNYEVYLRADCGQNNTETSVWAGPFAFTTLSNVGDACNLPIEINFPADFVNYVYSDSGQTTVGRGDNENQTFLNQYDEGRDIFYKLNVTQAGLFDIMLDPHKAKKTAIMVTEGCDVLDDDPIKANINTSYYAKVHGIKKLYLEEGEYIIMIDKKKYSGKTKIDTLDLTITNDPCPKIEEVNFSDITANSVSIDWNAIGAISYDIEVVDYLANPTGTATESAFTDKPKVLSNLLPAHRYNVYLKSNCDAENSEWSEPFFFETLPACALVQNITATEESSSSFKITWDKVEGASYELAFSTTEAMPDTLPYVSVTDTFFVANNLAFGKDYKVYVRSICGTNNYGNWSEAVDFQTPCGIFTSVDETFEKVTPNCWSELKGFLQVNSNIIETDATWGGKVFAGVSNSTNQSAHINVYGTDRKDWLVTPSIDLGTEGNKQLEFDLALTDFGSTNIADLSGIDDKFAVVISTDNGATWSSNNILKLWDNQGSHFVYNQISRTGEHNILYLNEYTGVVKLAFYAESISSNADNSLFVDNVKVNTVPGCLSAANVYADNITNNSADLHWDGQSDGVFEIKLIALSNTNAVISEDIIENVQGTTYHLSGLQEESRYKLMVRTNCDASGGNGMTNWSNPCRFTTYSSCPTPESVSSIIAGVDVQMQWDGLFVSHWDIEYGLEGFNPTGTPSINDVAEAQYLLQNLTPNAEYEFYVRSDCGQNNTEVSDWAGPFTFKTGCAALSELDEDFLSNTFPPHCWEEKKGELTDNTQLTGASSTTASSWYQGHKFANLSGDTCARMNVYNSGKYDWLLTPSIDLGANHDKQLEFDLALTKYNATTAAEGEGIDDKLVVVVSTDNGITWSLNNALRVWDNQGSDYVFNQISVTGERVVLPLNEYAGVVKIGFYFESTINNTDNDLFIDDVLITELATCSMPEGIEFEDITASSLKVNWEPTGSETQWEVKYGESGFDVESEGETVISDVASADLTNLTANTTYDVYVRAVCSDTEQSDWRASYTRTPNNESDFITFTHPNQVQEATINTEEHTVYLRVGNGINIQFLVPEFTLSENATAFVGELEQESGTSINDFTTPKTYKVVAEDSTFQNWTVTVEVSDLNDETDIVSFAFEEQTQEAVINADEHTIDIEVNWLADLSNLKATFSLSYGATAKVAGVTQESGVNVNDFTNPVVYVVKSENEEETENWTVTVSQADMPQGAQCEDPIVLTLPVNDLSGTTVNYGNDYNGYSMACQSTDFLSGEDIVYEFTIPEDGTISGGANYTGRFGSLFVLDGCPNQSTTNCVVSETTYYSDFSTSFTDVEISAGTYFLVISTKRLYSNYLNTDFTLNLSYEPHRSDSANILSYQIPNQVGETQILSEDKKVKVLMPYGTDLSALVADFTLSEGATATINGIEQVSGTTANDWSNNAYLKYAVMAEDASTIKNWKVYVGTVPNTENDILSFSIPNQISSEINIDEHKVTVTMPSDADLTSLVPEFTLSDEAVAKVQGVVQESGVSPHNWLTSNPIEYVVIAGNSEAKTWKVYVQKALNNAAEIEEFKLIPGIQSGTTVINSEEANISVEVTAQADLTDLIIFKLRASAGATVTYQGNEVVPQSTSIDASSPVTLVVTAEDGTVKEWEVSIKGSVALNSTSSFEVYPNPTKGIVNIKSDLDKDEWISVEVINTSGQVVKQIAKGNGNSNIDLSSQANGLYLIRINTTKGVAIKKVNLIK